MVSDQAAENGSGAYPAPRPAAAEDERLAAVREYIALQHAAAKAQSRKHDREIRALRAEIAALQAERNAPRRNGLARRIERWRETLRLHREAKEIRRSGLFDSAWYAARYGDIARSGMDPLDHYLRYGASESRDPNPDFDAAWYNRTYLGGSSGTNPLLDYIRQGARLGRDPNPHFRAAWYRSEYPDVAASGLEPLVHYQRFGRRDGRPTAPSRP